MTENTKYYEYMNSPLGWLEVICSNDTLFSVKFVPQKGKDYANALTNTAIYQLKEYFQGKRISFDINLGLSGSEFQKKAWNALLEIPFGETISYKKQAEKIGNSNAARAVGAANNKNRIAIIVPCHRVVGQNDALVGYRGGLEKKKFLLEHEKRIKNSIC